MNSQPNERRKVGWASPTIQGCGERTLVGDALETAPAFPVLPPSRRLFPTALYLAHPWACLAVATLRKSGSKLLHSKDRDDVDNSSNTAMRYI